MGKSFFGKKKKVEKKVSIQDRREELNRILNNQEARISLLERQVELLKKEALELNRKKNISGLIFKILFIV